MPPSPWLLKIRSDHVFAVANEQGRHSIATLLGPRRIRSVKMRRYSAGIADLLSVEKRFTRIIQHTELQEKILPTKILRDHHLAAVPAHGFLIRVSHAAESLRHFKRLPRTVVELPRGPSRVITLFEFPSIHRRNERWLQPGGRRSVLDVVIMWHIQHAPARVIKGRMFRAGSITSMKAPVRIELHIARLECK